MPFSAHERPQDLNALAETRWDLIVIGGGITGAGILLDAVSRGLKAVLIEKGDFASGTSSKSTKLIHGGLRYLKNFEIGLVREVGKERAIVYHNARHLVRPEPMLLPIYNEGSIGRTTGSIGLWFYDFLADVDKTERRKMLSLEDTLRQEPLLRPDGLLGSGLYYEYRTDDARLTLSVIKKAVQSGGLAINYCKATGLIYSDDHISGVRCLDMLTHNEISVSATVVVNATGPWMDSLLALQKENAHLEKKVVLSKGVHIVVPKEKLPVNQSLYFDVPVDDRMIFCIPRESSVYIGTTDTKYDGDVDDIEVTQDEATYLLTAVNQLMPGVGLTHEDVTGSWAGLRPLIHEEGKSTAELSRRDEIFVSPGGLISIAGGKLTGYRKMAERIVDLILKSEKFKDVPATECQTDRIRIAGSDFDTDQDMFEKAKKLQSEFLTFSPEHVHRLFYRYGMDTSEILSNALRDSGTSPEEALIRAEVVFSIHHEMTLYLDDFIYRRTSDYYFDRQYFKRSLPVILHAFRDEMQWDDARYAVELRSIQGAKRLS